MGTPIHQYGFLKHIETYCPINLEIYLIYLQMCLKSQA